MRFFSSKAIKRVVGERDTTESQVLWKSTTMLSGILRT